MSILVIHCNRRQETVSMPRHSLKQKKKWIIILGIQLRRQGVAFHKIANCWFARDVTTAMFVVQSISLLWKLNPIFMYILGEKKNYFVLTTNMAALSRGCKPRISLTWLVNIYSRSLLQL